MINDKIFILGWSKPLKCIDGFVFYKKTVFRATSLYLMYLITCGLL